MQIKYYIESGYKLCDFKPAYGLIFPDWIKDYDFWGYCDVDVIFGNIRSRWICMCPLWLLELQIK